MKHFLLISIFLLFGISAKAKDTTYIYFKKTDSKKVLRLKTPLKCRVYTSKKDKRVGRIMSYTDSTIVFEYKDYDTSDVNKIMAIDTLTRKEKYDLIDTMIQDSKYNMIIHQDSIYKIRLLSGSDNFGRELSLLGSSLLFMGSTAALMFDLSSNVGGKMQWWNWLEVGGIAAGIAGVAVLMKRDIYFSEWQLLFKES